MWSDIPLLTSIDISRTLKAFESTLAAMFEYRIDISTKNAKDLHDRQLTLGDRSKGCLFSGCSLPFGSFLAYEV